MNTLPICGIIVCGVVAVSSIFPALAVGILGLLGFSGTGPVAGKLFFYRLLALPTSKSPGSIAAALQSGVYGGAVVAGSAFAIAQSLSMR
jgi:hypothetical protein